MSFFSLSCRFLNNRLDLIRDNERCIITPNIVEFNRLCEALNAPKKCKEVARQIGVTVVQKGQPDVVAFGAECALGALEFCEVVKVAGVEVGAPTQPRRCGGQGDLLSGACAMLSMWCINNGERCVTAETS